MADRLLILAVLLAIAVGLSIVCSVGLLVMRDPFQRLHFTSPVVLLSVPLIALAVFLGDSDLQARIKIILIWAILFWMNPVLTHVTARAARISEVGHWKPTPDEKIPIFGTGRIAGVKRRRNKRRDEKP